jgi:hypothetical protein
LVGAVPALVLAPPRHPLAEPRPLLLLCPARPKLPNMSIAVVVYGRGLLLAVRNDRDDERGGDGERGWSQAKYLVNKDVLPLKESCSRMHYRP